MAPATTLRLLLLAAAGSALPYGLEHRNLTMCARPAGVGNCAVDVSGARELRRLIRSDASGTETVVARSYDRHPWEGLYPAPLALRCSASACTFLWDATRYDYRLVSVAVTPPSGTAHATSRLLMQATFGARKRDIAAFDPAGADDAAAAGAWFDAQVALSPTLVQAYTRARQNPRHTLPTQGAAYTPCEKGARYHAYAFTLRDAGKTLRVTRQAGVFVLRLNEQKLTEAPAFASGTGTYEVCRVAEAVGEGYLQVAAVGRCGGQRAVEANPRLSLGAVNAAELDALTEVRAADLKPLGLRMDTVILKHDQGACTADANAPLAFMRSGDAVYRYDKRVKLYANTVEAPVARGPAEVSPGVLCPAAEPSFMNEAQCVRGRSPCATAACGARGEVANDPELGNRFTFLPTPDFEVSEVEAELDWPGAINDAKMLPFHNIALSAGDQLRQRVAWALLQIIPVAEDGGGRLRDHSAYQQYLDIFVANAFGTYGDILKEVSRNALMGQYLSFRGNRAFASGNTLPDQNFARELMQLFTIGLWKLNPDGSEVLENGVHVPTYHTRDIVTFSRVWTGFQKRARRGNIEANYDNYVDPMYVVADDRDTLPKTNLDGGYLGDGYPLCADLPARHFLRRGARYRYHGNTSLEGPEFDTSPAAAAEDFTSMGVTVTVAGGVQCLHWTYCGNATRTLRAKFRIDVSANRNVQKIGGDAPELYLHGDNGAVRRVYGQLRLIDWASGTGGAQLHFYPVAANTADLDTAGIIADFEAAFPVGTRLTVHNSPVAGRAPESPQQYTAKAGTQLWDALCAAGGSGCTLPLVVTLAAELACGAGDEACEGLEELTSVKMAVGSTVHYYVYEPPPCVKLSVFAGRVSAHKRSSGVALGDPQCADPAAAVAGAACCTPDAIATGGVATWYRPPQCHVLGERMRYATAAARCAARGLEVCGSLRGGSLNYNSACAWRQQTWTSTPCGIDVQVNGDGLVNLVVGIDSDPRLQNSTGNTFYPQWADGFPTGVPEGCRPAEGGTIICGASVTDTAVFTAPPTRAEAEARLRIGAFDPTTLLRDEYMCADGSVCDGDVVVYTRRRSGMDIATIVGLRRAAPLGGGYAYYMNRESTVSVGGKRFRNPPNFMPLSGERPEQWFYPMEAPHRYYAARAAEHETDALLEHLLHHPNTAPFVVRLLIQRLVTSNPSPRYMTVATTAFTTGWYMGRGSGRYGCMHATVAAILLDREARSSTLDADPGYGVTREPFLKVLQVVRSLEFETSHGQEVHLAGLMRWIGEDVFMTTSVFGFYLPNHMPKGPLGSRGLVSPETELSIAPRLFGLLNGLAGIVEDGLTSCNDGFGFRRTGMAPGQTKRDCRADVPEGRLTFDPLAGAPAGPSGFPDAAVAAHVVDELDAVLTGGRLSPESKASILQGMTLYTPQTVAAGADLSACRTHAGYALVDNCACGEPCRVGDLCKRESDGRGEPPRGCVRVDGRPWTAMADNTSQPCCSRPDAAAATAAVVKDAVTLMMLAPEFHTSNLRGAGGAVRTLAPPAPVAGDLEYKAVVSVILEGGADSFNYMIPGDRSKCAPPLSYDQYASIRGAVTLPKGDLLPITTNPAEQPCSQFYLQKNLTNVRDMYNAGDAAFFANMGNLVEPVTRETKKTARLPPFLFAHNTQRREVQSMHPQMSAALGVLGRMADATPGRTNLYTMDRIRKIVEAQHSTPTVLDTNDGVTRLHTYGEHRTAITNLATNTSGSFFAETFGADLQRSLDVTEDLGQRFEAFDDEENTFPDTSAGKQLRRISQVMRLRDNRGQRIADRDMFAMRVGGFDTHSAAYEETTKTLDDALKAFKEEMQRQGSWGDVVLVVMSDFGRTLPSNGQGTDHAWGGNYFAVGGSVRDQAVLGRYPDTLGEEGPQHYGHGIMIPAQPYEAMWAPIAAWVGVPREEMDDVLPNLKNFPGLETSEAALFDSNETTGGTNEGGVQGTSDGGGGADGAVIGGVVAAVVAVGVAGAIVVVIARKPTVAPKPHPEAEMPEKEERGERWAPGDNAAQAAPEGRNS